MIVFTHFPSTREEVLVVDFSTQTLETIGDGLRPSAINTTSQNGQSG